jgi:hypothetical protein
VRMKRTAFFFIKKEKAAENVVSSGRIQHS